MLPDDRSSDGNAAGPGATASKGGKVRPAATIRSDRHAVCRSIGVQAFEAVRVPTLGRIQPAISSDRTPARRRRQIQ